MGKMYRYLPAGPEVGLPRGYLRGGSDGGEALAVHCTQSISVVANADDGRLCVYCKGALEIGERNPVDIVTVLTLSPR